jgi:hypothetical protein
MRVCADVAHIVAIDPNDVPHAQVLPASLRCAAVGADAVDDAIVYVEVGFVAVKIVVHLLQHVDHQDEGEREDGGEPVGGRQAGDELQDGNERKVLIGAPAELLEEVEWEEGDERVLGGAHKVARDVLESQTRAGSDKYIETHIEIHE